VTLPTRRSPGNDGPDFLKIADTTSDNSNRTPEVKVEALAIACTRGEIDVDELLGALGLVPLAVSSTGVLHVPNGAGSVCRSDIAYWRHVYGATSTCRTCLGLRRYDR
jgi:hypothetical protein